MKDNNLSKDNKGNKDIESKKNGILLDISEELKKENIVSEIKYLSGQNSLKITFSKFYDNDVLYIPTDAKHWYKWIEKLESMIKMRMPKLNNRHRCLIENTLHENFLLLDNAGVNSYYTQRTTLEEERQEGVKKIHLRKYALDGQLYESVVVDKSPKFLTISTITSDSIENNNNGNSDEQNNNNNNIQFKLVEKIEVPNYEFYPADSLVTHNPIPYSFESEDDIKEYIELAKNETFDSLFQKILVQIRNYVNIEEHVLVILAADTLYSYFQEKFGTTHYNIFIGENGSGKNSALLFFKMLGYRVFYVTAASAANYYTFLGEIQEGQGTIAEDEADDIGYNKDKQIILKTGYAKGGNVPKVEFSRNGGSRSQASFLTFCHKWLTMEELPDEKRIRGVLDRSFIFKFIIGDVKYNIKDILEDENSEQYKQLVHIRKLLFVFKLINQNIAFQNIKLNIKNRNSELTKPLLRIFYNTDSFDKIRNALSELIREKTELKSNSLESKIIETLNKLMQGDDKEIFVFSNDTFYNALQELMDARTDSFYSTDSTFYLPDGTKLSKRKIYRIMLSKFKAKPFRTKEKRGFQINKKDIDKLSKQYEVVDEIKVLDELPVENEDIKSQFSNERVTQMTDMTHFKGAIPSSSCQNANADDQYNGVDDNSCSDNSNNKEDGYDYSENKDIGDAHTSVLNPVSNDDKDLLNEPTLEDKVNKIQGDDSNRKHTLKDVHIKQDNIDSVE